MRDVINNVGELLMVAGVILTKWVTLPILLTLGIRGRLKKRKDKK